MAKDTEQASPAPSAAPAAGGKSNKKTMVMGGIVLGVMIAEGLTVFILAKHFGPQPPAAEAHATGLEAGEGKKAPEDAEVEVVQFRSFNEKVRNMTTYDITVFAVVSEENQEKFTELVKRKQAVIRDRFSSVVRSADPEVLQEPDPATLRQKLRQELTQIVGDEGMIRQVLIPTITMFRSE